MDSERMSRTIRYILLKINLKSLINNIFPRTPTTMCCKKASLTPLAKWTQNHLIFKSIPQGYGSKIVELWLALEKCETWEAEKIVKKLVKSRQNPTKIYKTRQNPSK